MEVGGHRRRRGSDVGPALAAAGFTLLEALVAVAAVGMLAGLLLPLAARARVRARQESCAGNLRRLAQAVQLYAQDFDGFPPPASLAQGREVPGVTWYDDRAYWPYLLRPYATPDGSTAVFRCPDAPFEPVPFGDGMEWKTYAINAHVAARVPDLDHGLPSRPLSAVLRPESVGLFVDSAGVCLLYAEDFASEPVRETSYFWGATAQVRSTYPAHFGGVNLAYVDGHVGWLPRSSYVGAREEAGRFWGSPYGQ